MDYAQQLAAFAHILEQKRLVTALEGNASVIDRQTGLTYVTPSGRMKLLLEKEDICVMNAAGEQIGGRGRRSSEYLLHEAVYQARPDVTASSAPPRPSSAASASSKPPKASQKPSGWRSEAISLPFQGRWLGEAETARS